MTRKHKLNMPQLLWGGLSENWLLKELGDIHWAQIMEALDTSSDELVDSKGDRLYASFVRLSWKGTNIYQFSENEVIELASDLSQYGHKMFFSKTTCTGTSGKLKAQLMSIFSTRVAADNQQLKKGNLKSNIVAKGIKRYQHLPVFAKKYIDHKNLLFHKDSQLTKEVLFQKSYQIDPYDDINGVGLLYFASYPKINDKCERAYIHSAYKLESDWLVLGGVISRDIHYYGNANPEDTLIYELNDLTEKDGKIKLESTLYRASDQRLIAKISTEKVLPEGVSLDAFKVENSIESIAFTKILAQVTTIQEETPVAASPRLLQDKPSLNKIIIGFLENMLAHKDLHTESNLSNLGIESIVYLELSAFLESEYNIIHNPSLFYGASTINDLSDYILGNSPNARIERKSKSKESEAIAIIGMSGRFPGAANIDRFWENIKTNQDSISEIPSERWDWRNYVKSGTLKSKWGGFIEGIREFDPLFFGISPQEAKLMDPQHRITLQAVYAALEDAAINPITLKGGNTGVFIGVSGSDYSQLQSTTSKEQIEAYHSIGTASSVLANRISYFLDIHGPSQAVDTACSSSLVAIHEGIKQLKDDTCDLVIVGGVNALLSPNLSISYSHAGMLSEDGRCKTFDANANGYVRSEGVGIVILKKLKRAEEDGDRIYGIIKGSAVNHGGRSNSLTAPNPQAQKDLLINAYTSANVDPRSVSYIEAHGTGTPLGDPIEIEGIKLAFEELYQQKGYEKPLVRHCSIGSVKANIGHLEAAAGVAGLIKIVKSLQHRLLPGNPQLKVANKLIELEKSPFILQKETTEWEMDKDKPRIAGVSSFGFGGTNAHLVLEEYQQEKIIYQSDDPAIILVSAKNKERLMEQVVNLSAFLENNVAVNLYDIAYTLQIGRTAMEERLALVVKDLTDLKTQLQQYQEEETTLSFTGTVKQIKTNVLVNDIVDNAHLEDAITARDADSLAQLWVKGVVIDWTLLYQENNPPSKISLPTYPFAKEKHWFLSTPISVDPLITSAEFTVLSFIKKILSNILHIEEEILEEEVFISDFGVDSIQLNKLATAINSQFHLDLTQTEMYDCLTINELTHFVEEKIKTQPHITKNFLKNNKPQTEQEEIAIIGLDVAIKDANSLQALQHLLDGETYSISHFPHNRWDLLPTVFTNKQSPEDFKGNFLEDPLSFDHKLFKISNREAMLMDPQQRLLLQSVWGAIENAAYTQKEFSKRLTSVYVAINSVDYADIVKYDAKIDEFSGRGVKRYVAANRISHYFNLKGESEPIDTACSSFFVGIKKAMDAIRRGTCEQAIIAGVQLNLLPFMFKELSAQGILSDGERTLPFDKEANGFIRSEGVCTIILKKKSAALKDRDQVYACLKGSGIAHGGRTLNTLAPNTASHKQAFLNALEDSGVEINQIQAIEAHGTGMPLGDASELQAFQEVFTEKGRGTSNPCIIGATKSILGHLEAASGGLALLKGILSLKSNKIHGIKGLREVDSAYIQSSFSISPDDQALLDSTNERSIIGLHSYGIGGVSAFLLLAKSEKEMDFKVVGRLLKVFVLSAASVYALRNYAQEIWHYLSVNRDKPDFHFEHFLASYQLNRESRKVRLAIVVTNAKDLLSKLKTFLDNEKQIAGVFGSPSLQLEQAEERDRLKELAYNWVKGENIDWQIDSISRYAYPTYPMDTRKCFWIKEARSAHAVKTSLTQPKKAKGAIKKSKYLMLDM